MRLSINKIAGLSIAMAVLSVMQVHAEYYNSALGPAYRTTQTTMQQAIADGKTANSIVTSIKNQGSTGTCWAFAINAAVETSLMKQMENASLTPQDLNFSQKYTAWMMYERTKAEKAKMPNSHPFFVASTKPTPEQLKGYPKTEPNRTAFKILSEGGLIEQEVSTLMGGFLVPQNGSEALKFYSTPETAAKNIVDAVIPTTYKAKDIYTKYGVNNSMGVNSIGELTQLQKYKDLLKTTGSLGIGYFSAGDNTTNTAGAVYNSLASSPDHAVLVVGFDDDYDFTDSNLPIKPPGKGAWIVKNSWGTNMADAGYYYISYYDKTVSFSYATNIEADIARYSITDTHTPLYTKEGLVDNLGQPVRSNAYISQYTPTKNQFLKAVSFMTSSDGASYKIEILKNTNNPDSKPIYTQTGTFSGNNIMSGYHTVDLDNFVLVPQKENYAIRITITGTDGVEILRYSSLDSREKTVNVVYNEGNSLYKNSSGQWMDSKKWLNGAVVLNGQAKETISANGGDFTVTSLNTNKNSDVQINLGKANEAYTTDLLNPNRKTISNMTVDSTYQDDDFWGTITGEGKVIKTGLRELSFYKDNSYTGNTIVNQGVLSNLSSIASNVEVKSGAFYRVLNGINETINQRGINNEGSVYIAADKQGVINFAKETAGVNNVLEGPSTGTWYLNAKDLPLKNNTTNGTVIINSNTDNVLGNVYLVNGTISSGQTSLFANAIKHNSDDVKINLKSQPVSKKTSSGIAKVMTVAAPAATPIAEVNLGKMVIEGDTEIGIDAILGQAELTTDLIKGTVVNEDGTDDNTANKIILGFILDEDITFSDEAEGISANVAQGQIGIGINNSAFVIDRNNATGSYNIYYSYDEGSQEGKLQIINAAAPNSLQDAIASAVTSKYYALDASQVLSGAWNPILGGNDLTLVGNNTEIDGDNNIQIFNVSDNKILSIKDLSIIKGAGTAIHNEGTLSISSVNSEVRLAQNEGVNGGALYNKDELTLSTLGNDIKLQGNTSINGAGIYNDTNAEAEILAFMGDIVFDSNQSISQGGAVYNKGALSVWADGGKVQFSNNTAESGAGIYNKDYLSIYATEKAIEFSNNTAAVKGAAIVNDGGYVEIHTQGGSVNFSQNNAQQGGAIYNTKPDGADPAIIDLIAEEGNISFDGNISSDKGGAIYNTETINILAFENQNVSFNQSTDTIYNTGIINLNYNDNYDSTDGLILTGAQFGGAGVYKLYGGELAFTNATDNQNTHGSISNEATLSVMNDAFLNLANGIKETFAPGTLTIAENTALFVAIDCIINGNDSEADFLDAGIYNGENTSQIIISSVNLLNPNNENKNSYRIKIAGSALLSAISENILAEIAGFRSAYSSSTGDLLLLSTTVKGLINYVEGTDSSRIYSMDADELVIFPLGVMGGENSTLTIEGNNNKVISEYSDIDGIIVSSTNTLNVKNVFFDNFETAISNQGALSLNNVIFNGQADESIYDVTNTNIMKMENTVSGKVLNSGLLMAINENDLSALTIRTINGSILDLRGTTNDVELEKLTIAGNVDLYLNGVNKLSSDEASRDEVTDSLVIKTISKITSSSTTVTDTDDLKPFIKIAYDANYTLADSAKPIGTYSAYNLTYSDGDISINGINLSDTTAKSGSINIETSSDFVASATNSVNAETKLTLNGSSSGLQINIVDDTTISGTLGLNKLTTSGSKLIVDNNEEANLILTDSTINNELDLNGGNTEVKGSSLNGQINVADVATLSFTSGVNTVNGAIVGQAGSNLVIDAPTYFNGEVDPVTEIVNSLAVHNANVSMVDFIINEGGELVFKKDSYLSNDHTNTLEFNGGSLNLMNDIASTITLQSLNFSPASSEATISNIFVDVDLANKTMDKLVSSNTNVGSGSILSVSEMRLLSDAKGDYTSINFTENEDLKGIVTTSLSSVAYSPIFQYLVDYNNANGNFNFTRSFNPSVLASSVAAQVGSYLTQINNYEQAFGNMDMMMSMTTEQRQAVKFANKYAAAGVGANLVTFSPNQIPEKDKGMWFKPYTTFENVGLKNGPTVRNIAYGSLFGGDSPIIELKNGWDTVFTGYAGYNGSQQNYDGIGISQNGATLGATGVFYKENFFTGLTANVGANVAEANTMYGREDFTMLTAGIASKTGYNFELADGKFIIQPNYLMSYSFVNTFNYTNAAGVNINSDPLNAIQIAPGIKFIGNLKNGWQPYTLAQMVWNVMDQTKFSANDVSLPELSVKPYIQYGIGVQRRWGENFTGYGQAMIRNGGRNGIALQFGFRIALGKNPKKTTEGKTFKTANAEPKKCNINLQSFKSDKPL